MKIYFDNCSIQRPLDDKTQLRIAAESEIILGILSLIGMKKIELVSSEALIYEISKNTNTFRREFAIRILNKAHEFVMISDRIENRAEEFIRIGIKPIDALHLASAEEADADYFCTCDDKFLKKAKDIKDLRVRIVSISDMMGEL